MGENADEMVHGSKMVLRSRSASCCLTIASIHFLRLIYVLAHSVSEYPFRPRWINVIGKPPFGSGFSEGGGASGCIPAGRLPVELRLGTSVFRGRFCERHVPGSSAVGEMRSSSSGIGYHI